MKHIKKKYGFEANDEQVTILEDKGISFSNFESLDKKVPKDHVMFLKTSEGDVVKGFNKKVDGLDLIITMPDLSLVYFDSAYQINSIRKDLLKQLKIKTNSKDVTKIEESAMQDIYKYYGFASSCIISLFTSMESFINSVIPDGGEYRDEQNQRTLIYNKDQIQRNLSFHEKTRKVLPFFLGKSYFKKTTTNIQHINNLKDIRDEIVHPKHEKQLESHQALLQTLLTFKFDKTIDAVASFINYYKPNFVEECKCGNDY
ncbi:hypothetical protein [Mesonia sp. K4-1]|uniref:hypothetical protein n=1 Tax=Mesonia sp. K4-1 TaxID=2602760 RepID=UPI0011C7EC50|nr:hypothetical protein [Mesonia sp. K4-1]TXK78692.1 hypothetical protein FT986_02545 [Mesonia sp. K4-1]